MPKAAKPGLGKSHLSDLVQCTLNGSAQRPSPEEHRARPAATVPAQANRRKKRKAIGSAGEPPAAAARSPTAASQGHSDRQPAATAAQDGSPGKILIGNYHVGGPSLDTPNQNVLRWAAGTRVHNGVRKPVVVSQVAWVSTNNLESENLPHL